MTVTQLQSLVGRRAVVTGAAGGLGRIICTTLAELGAAVIMVDLPDQITDIDANRPNIATNSAARAIQCDLESEDERRSLISALSSESNIDILVNNAAIVGTSDLKGWSSAFAEQRLDSWRRALEVNLTAVFHLSQGLSPSLAASDSGCIVNIASIYGLYAPDYALYEGTDMGSPAAYAASKGGLVQLTRWMATTLAPRIRVNCIAPGGIERGQPEKFVKRYEARTPLARMAHEGDFAGPIAFLASDMSRYMTGQVLVVDGGWGV